MKSGLIVFGLCVLGSIGLSVWLASIYGREMPPTQDLITGLLYFMEQHEGRFPASEKEFVESSFVEKVPGGIRILPQPNSMFRRETHGVIIGDLKPFQVAWGADFEKIRFNEYGKPKDMDGEPLTLVSMPTVQSSGQNYTFMLVSFHNQILEKLKAASKPATP